jgi:hypothetical protein
VTYIGDISEIIDRILKTLINNIFWGNPGTKGKKFLVCMKPIIGKTADSCSMQPSGMSDIEESVGEQREGPWTFLYS